MKVSPCVAACLIKKFCFDLKFWKSFFRRKKRTSNLGLFDLIFLCRREALNLKLNSKFLSNFQSIKSSQHFAWTNHLFFLVLVAQLRFVVAAFRFIVLLVLIAIQIDWINFESYSSSVADVHRAVHYIVFRTAQENVRNTGYIFWIFCSILPQILILSNLGHTVNSDMALQMARKCFQGFGNAFLHKGMSYIFKMI